MAIERKLVLNVLNQYRFAVDMKGSAMKPTANQ
jgi:hypothetical protein